MYNHTIPCRKKHFCHHCLQAFGTEKKILKRHTKDCFKIKGNKELQCLKKANMLNSKIMNKN